MAGPVLWVLVNCASIAGATRMGEAALRARRAACFDVFSRARARYFWPPRTGKTEEVRGALLVLETFAEHVRPLKALIRARHPDTLPFIGALRIAHVDVPYRAWMAGELRSRRRRSRKRV